MIVNSALKTVTPFVPVVDSGYGFVKTYFRVYNATSPTKALVAGVKRIVIDYTPFVIKYPLSCAEAISCGDAFCLTGDPNFAVGALEYCSAIVWG